MKILITNLESLHTPGGPATFVGKLVAQNRSLRALTYRNLRGTPLHPWETNLAARTFLNEIVWISRPAWKRLWEETAVADLVHLNLFNFSELALAFLMKWRGKKLVWTLHSRIVLSQRSPKVFLEHLRLLLVFNLLLPFVARAVFLTEAHRENYRRHTPFRGLLAARGRVVPHGIEPERIAARRVAPPSPLSAIYAGRFEKSKGFGDLLRLAREMETDDIRFVFVGGPAPPPVPGVFRKNVRFRDPVPNDRLFAFYDEANVLLLPSRSESFGIVILEAMARGLVILVSDIPGMREIVTEHRNGFLFPPGDTERMKQILRHLGAHPEEMDRIGQNNLEDVRRFSTAALADRYRAIYHEVLACDR